MPIYVSDSGSKDFEPAPQGTFPMVCCDVVDRGMVDGKFGPRHMVEIRWQIDGHSEASIRDDGKPWLVVRRFGATLNEKGTLRPFLEGWRGRKFTEQELEKFDLERLIGVPCLGQILHNLGDNGKTYANVQTVMALPKSMIPPEILEYVRVKDRGGVEAEEAEELEEEAVAF